MVSAGKTEVEIVSRRVVKPFSQTLPHLRNLKLSLLDQLMPPWLYCNSVHFYVADSRNPRGISEKLSSLRKSLSETLVLFYPLEGSLKDAATIEWNDAGTVFIDARIDTRLSEFLDKPTSDLLDCFFPFNDPETMENPETMEKLANPMLLVQVTVFCSGGLALAACPSHKRMDASSMCTFMKTWAKVTAIHNGREENLISIPKFLGLSIMAPNKNLPDLPFKSGLIDNPKSTSRRFVFSASKIKALKASCKSIAASGDKRPSRVEVVQALELKCAIRAASRAIRGFSKTLNLRNRIKPPVSEDAVGNLNWTLPFFIEEGPLVQEIVGTLRRGVKKFYDEKTGRFNPREGLDVMLEGLKERAELKGNVSDNFYAFASLCRFPFDEIDFGWGKPTRITNPSMFWNACYMVDSRSGNAIEAWMRK